MYILFIISHRNLYLFLSNEIPCYGKRELKGGPSDLGTKNYKITEKSSLYPQSLLFFIHKTPVVESHPTTSEIRDLLRPTGNTVYFYMSTSLIYTCEASNIASNETLRKNNYMFVMLLNLSVITHWIFPQCPFDFWRRI